MGLAPWCENEKWTYGADDTGKRWARVEGREPCPPDLKKDYSWWVLNSFEQQVPDWYHPEWPPASRELYWNYFRNPFQNARLFVWGWADQNYTVTVDEGNPDPMVIQRNDVGETGYQRTRLTRTSDGARRAFTSYCGGKVVWYFGTQPSGLYGAKFNLT